VRPAPERERTVGVAHYASDADGIGGRLRERPEDFRVRELEAFDTEAVDADPDDYPHVVLRVTLRDWDTNDFAGRLSDAMGISRERIGWAGTKDKRAVTTQLFSVDRVDPAAVPAVSGADVEVVGRAGRSLHFGDLAGNAFTVRVTDVTDPDCADAVTEDLRAFVDEPADGTIGVPNYFGLQRFGSKRPITHTVGLAIVRGEWEAAVMAYLADSFSTEPDRTREAREFVADTRDWSAALERFPNGLGYERSMLHHLAANGGTDPGDFQGALDRLPSNLQRLFVHAAQSLAFNRIVSERLERGLALHEPVTGDTVCFADRDAPGGADADDGQRLILPDTDRLQAVTAERVASVARHCERGRAFVTAPLVGTDTTLADGEPGEIERAVLDDLDLSPTDFDLPDPYRSSGTRRAVLVRTALDVETDGGDTAETDAVTVDFALPRGSYATVVLREYLKGDPLARS
jgi:tRNA pseudouridine13 synthase